MSALYANLKGHAARPCSPSARLDAFLDDSLFVYARWIAAGNEAELAIYPGAIHGFNMFPYALATKPTRASTLSSRTAWHARRDAMTGPARTRVAIIGAGPAGLFLGRLLDLAGIDSVILDARDPRLCREPRARRRARSRRRGGAGRGRRRRAAEARRPWCMTASSCASAASATRIDLKALTGRDDHRLRPARGREGPHRGAQRRRDRVRGPGGAARRV